MPNIYKGTLGLIGKTPLVEVVNIEKSQNLEATDKSPAVRVKRL